MTKEGWREAVIRAATDPVMLDLLARLLAEQDQAKQRLRDLGYGWIGLPWHGTVDEIERIHDAR